MEAIVYNLSGRKKKVCHNSYIHIHDPTHTHTHSKHMQTHAYTNIYTQRKRIRIDLPTSKICEAQMRYTQMIFDKYAIKM